MIQPIVAREKAVSVFFFPVGADSFQLRHLLKSAATTKRTDTGPHDSFTVYLQDRHSRSQALVLIADVRTWVTKEISDLDFVGANDRLNENTGHRFFSLARLKEEKRQLSAMRVSLPFPAGYLRCYGCRYCCLLCSSVSGSMCSRLAWGFEYKRAERTMMRVAE
jgi:hypothetical protein